MIETETDLTTDLMTDHTEAVTVDDLDLDDDLDDDDDDDLEADDYFAGGGDEGWPGDDDDDDADDVYDQWRKVA